MNAVPETYERIENLCSQKGVTITLMCKECGIPRATLTDYKKGRVQSLSAKTLAKIAEYFGVSVDYLYGANTAPDIEHALKAALFGGDGDVTDEMWDEVKRYARYIREKGSK